MPMLSIEGLEICLDSVVAKRMQILLSHFDKDCGKGWSGSKPPGCKRSGGKTAKAAKAVEPKAKAAKAVEPKAKAAKPTSKAAKTVEPKAKAVKRIVSATVSEAITGGNDTSGYARPNLNSYDAGRSLRTPTQSIKKGSSDTSAGSADSASDAIKNSKLGRNIIPVYTKETASGEFETVANAHILEGAKKAKSDFVRSLSLNGDMQNQLKAEMSGSSKPKSSSAVKKWLPLDDDPTYGTVRRGEAQQLPANLITGKSNADPAVHQAIAEKLKISGKNISPVFVRPTDNGGYESLANTHILEGAKKAKSDFVQAIQVDKEMYEQVLKEMGTGGEPKPKKTRKKKTDSSDFASRYEKALQWQRSAF